MSIPRAEHIGSLKRPDVLLRTRSNYVLSKCTAAELRACEDACIAEIVRLQLDLGFEVITDGDFRRQVLTSCPRSWYSRQLFSRDIFYAGLYDQLSGLKEVVNGMHLRPHSCASGH